MTILALEFSSDQRSVAILHGDAVSEIVETGGRHTAAFGMIDKALTGAGVQREQVDVIAVGLGPGSYTGIRSAIAIAQGWGLARPVRLVGVSGAEAIAARARIEKFYGSVNVVIDAQRGEVYHARFDISAAAIRETGPLRIIAPDQLKPSDEEKIIGPEAARWSGRVVFPQARTVAQLAKDRPGIGIGQALEPIYLRETTFVKAPPPRDVA